MKKESFRRESSAMDELDRVLDKGTPVGMLTSVYYLPYLPEALRFHFNAHNIVVYGKRNGSYLVSDPIMETVTEIDSKDLQRARFAKGALSPNGKMYYPIVVPKEMDLKKPIVAGIKKTAVDMTTIPVPLFGIRGQRYLAKKVAQYPDKLEKKSCFIFRKYCAYAGRNRHRCSRISFHLRGIFAGSFCHSQSTLAVGYI